MKFRGKNKISPDFSMAAMTDIVFQLLIFFMLTSTVANQSALNVKLPKSSTEETQVQQTHVSITKEGAFFVNDKPVAQENLAQILKETLATSDTKAFVLRADEDSKNKDMVFVLSIANENKYPVAIATKTEK